MPVNEAYFKDNETFFKGRVILVYLKHGTEDIAGGIAISDPKIRNINDRLFVCGMTPAGIFDWTAGQRVGVALDEILHFVEFDNEQDFFEKSTLAFDGNGNA